MTGLDLELFLHLLRADLAAWASLGLVALVLALMTWTSWGSRRALRKCLVLSIVVHLGLVAYGGTVPFVWRAVRPSPQAAERPHIRQIRVTPQVEESPDAPRGPTLPGQGPGRRRVAPWDRPRDTLALADPVVPRQRPAAVSPERGLPDRPPALPRLDTSTATPELAAVAAPLPEPKPPAAERREPAPLVPPQVAPGDPGDIPEVVVAGQDEPGPEPARTRQPADSPGGTAPPPPTVASPRLDPPDADLRRRARPDPGQTSGAADAADAPRRPAQAAPPISLARVAPSGLPGLPEIPGATAGRPLRDVPEVYRSRLGPNRAVMAQRAGASAASEQAVERALDWLARHQDAEGNWDGATARRGDGSPVKGDDDFTVHCPPGETCFGESLYWEADTALTGLALLAYLGAGYTQADGKYAETVGKGLDYLLREQKPDGDLRGRSRAVGMYCHAMATLALCEAYALTGDERLRGPVERAVRFIVRSRARDGLVWRYTPGDPTGDTSILGWVVLALKSASAVGIAVPAPVQEGVRAWLDKVASGAEGGLACYQPRERVTPTMTAEAWACRQFLGFGGPGPASSEAADYLLGHESDGGTSNYYYWYYGTLAMYQHGGAAWSRWNDRVRDQIVGRQRVQGHQAGSWDPDDSKYGAAGGRIYGTALAALSLEVYYRFLRLYDDPQLAPVPDRAGDPAPRRAQPVEPR